MIPSPNILYSDHSYNSQNLGNQDCANLGEDESSEADDLDEVDNISNWLQHECGSGSKPALGSWDSQLIDDTIKEW